MARPDEVRAKQGHQRLPKFRAVMMPTSGIRKFNMQTGPTGPQLSAPHNAPDRTNHHNNCLGIKLSNLFAQARFAGRAKKLSRSRFHPVDRLAAKIDDVASERSKRF
jgi:hypothetical protein